MGIQISRAKTVRKELKSKADETNLGKQDKQNKTPENGALYLSLPSGEPLNDLNDLD